jgi:hypothetical protein
MSSLRELSLPWCGVCELNRVTRGNKKEVKSGIGC